MQSKGGKKCLSEHTNELLTPQQPLPELAPGNKYQVLCLANTQQGLVVKRKVMHLGHVEADEHPSLCPSTQAPGQIGSWIWSTFFSVLPASSPPATSVLPELPLLLVLAEGGPGKRGALRVLRSENGFQGPRATVLSTVPCRTWPLPSKGTCGIWKHSCALKAPSAPWWKLPTQGLNFPLLFYTEQSLLLKSPHKFILSQT